MTMFKKGRVGFSESHRLGLCGSEVKFCLHWSACRTNWAPTVWLLPPKNHHEIWWCRLYFFNITRKISTKYSLSEEFSMTSSFYSSLLFFWYTKKLRSVLLWCFDFLSWRRSWISPSCFEFFYIFMYILKPKTECVHMYP